MLQGVFWVIVCYYVVHTLADAGTKGIYTAIHTAIHIAIHTEIHAAIIRNTTHLCTPLDPTPSAPQHTHTLPPPPKHPLPTHSMYHDLAHKTLALGITTGLTIGSFFYLCAPYVIHAFTNDPLTAAALPPRLWGLVCFFQVVNGATFVYDGLLYALQAFAYVRNLMVLGTVCMFVPVLVVLLRVDGTLFAVWGAKGALNVWRCGAAALRVHWGEL